MGNRGALAELQSVAQRAMVAEEALVHATNLASQATAQAERLADLTTAGVSVAAEVPVANAAGTEVGDVRAVNAALSSAHVALEQMGTQLAAAQREATEHEVEAAAAKEAAEDAERRADLIAEQFRRYVELTEEVGGAPAATQAGHGQAAVISIARI